jgi:predicted PurR-regulated permease PerM
MTSNEDRAFVARAVEASIRIGLVALLVFWCFHIVQPFIQPAVWGVILATAASPAYGKLRDALGGRQKLAAAVLVLGTFLLLSVPAVLITTSLVDSASHLAGKLDEGAIEVPPPPSSVADWPIVGDPIHAFWANASRNLEDVLAEARPMLLSAGKGALGQAAAASLGILMFGFSIVIAGVLLGSGWRTPDAARRIARRLAPERGDELVDLTRDTVGSVTVGILGVALIQAIGAGIGLLVAGVPAAGLWALLVLFFAVVQLPAILILGPIIVYVFATASTGMAVVFTVWSLVVSFSDNFLKPLLLGRGVQIPTLVIFMGAIGGFLLQGIIGLFVGAVVLAVGYTLLNDWLSQAP